MSVLALRALIPRRTPAAILTQRYLVRRNLAAAMSVIQCGARHTPSRPLATASNFKSLVDNHPATLEFQKRQSVILTRSALEPHQYNLTDTTLSGEDMIHPTPCVFTDVVAGSVIAFYRLGRKLSGHDGIIHGGFSATLLDECMYRACLARLPGKMAVTANLNINYKNPIPVESTVLLRAETTKVEGRKVWVKATIENVDNEQILVVAEALFIQPKWASSKEESSDGREG